MKGVFKKNALYFVFAILTMFCFVNIVNAQEGISNPVLDDISKNNGGVRFFNDDTIYALSGDAIRVSGVSQERDEITVYFNDIEYKANYDRENSWFVLFSIPEEITEDEYIIEAQAKKGATVSEKVTLLTIAIGEEPIEEVTNGEEVEEGKKSGGVQFKDVLIIVLFLTVFILSWLLLSPKIFKEKK